MRLRDNHSLAALLQERDGNLCDIRLLPEFRSLHSDPRWQAFLEAVGLSDRQIEALDLQPFPR